MTFSSTARSSLRKVSAYDPAPTMVGFSWPTSQSGRRASELSVHGLQADLPLLKVGRLAHGEAQSPLALFELWLEEEQAHNGWLVLAHFARLHCRLHLAIHRRVGSLGLAPQAVGAAKAICFLRVVWRTKTKSSASM
eukprot:TRINITY_DN1253_c1_g1_i7.p1 TRINITY_DN1253_c1_g1~~TRINITY_DN1253_c1_g1_i7.p1  ORF type:complete len:137 (+),score=6.16 TRINITY_DN1253_c1_g1_i7:196-606(+)